MSRLTGAARLALVVGLSLAGALAAFRIPLLAQIAPPKPAGKASQPSNFDVRISASLRARTLQQLGRSSDAVRSTMNERRKQSADAITALQRDLPGVEATFSSFTGGVDVVRNPRGALTPPSGGATSQAVVMDFLQSHAEVYGLSGADIATLQTRGESVSRGSGLRMLRIDQVVHGLPVFQTDARFILDRQGRLVRSVGTLMPGAANAAAPSPVITAAQALIIALQSVNITIDAGQITTTPRGPALSDASDLTVNDMHIGGPATSKLGYFPLAPGVLVLAYQQMTFTDTAADWLTIVDATNGTLLWRKNTRAYASTQQARFSVYVQADGVTPADSPAPHSPTTATPGSGTQFPAIARTIVEMLTAQDIVASPNGWINDGDTTTTGNNVDACLDRVGGGNADVCDTGTLDIDGRPIGNPDAATLNRDFLGNAVRDFNYTPAPAGGNPDVGDTPTGTGAVQDVFRRGAVTQLFYVTNWYHDRLYNLGFDEAAGNFQNTNFSGMGLGNDRVRADAQDSSGTNNANFSTPPDGTSGRMQMYRFTAGTADDRDGDLDAEIVIHELTHGTSNRLMGNGSGLVWNIGGGMGEGWSDFYALSLLNNTNADDPNGQYASGAYATYKLGGLTDNYVYGIRRFPYTTDNSINPLTWADVDDVTANYSGGIPISPLGFQFGGGMEVHNVGEIWALTLWEVRARVIADPAGANGDVPTGNQTMLQLVTDAMKLTPANPTFLQARDALIDADCATNNCANERWIWEGFADRGLGFDARAPLAIGGGTGDLIGHMGVASSTAMPHLNMTGFTIDDSIGNNSGGVDEKEPVKITVDLANPWHGAAFSVASATATLTSSTPGVTIVDGTSTYGAIAPQGTASGDSFTFIAPVAGCGEAISFTLTVTSALGTSSQDFTVRLGVPSGTQAPVTYTNTLGSPLAIPDDRPVGVASTITITDDFEIADLDFRIDSLTHTFSGDITAMLRGPSGYGSDFIWRVGLLTDGGSGHNFVNTLIDDASTNDLLGVLPASAPYTGTWAPAYNSSGWFSVAYVPDLVGQLSYFNGQSTKGVWTTLVSDNAIADTGTLNGWSIIVTPRAFSCTAYVDPAPATAIQLTPIVPSGLAGWYTTAVSVSVIASDPNVGGGVAETRCAIDPPSVPATFADLPSGCAFTAPGAVLSTPGPHVIYAASVDNDANQSNVAVAALKIDATPPVLTCDTPAPAFTLNQAGATVTASITDALSGVLAPTVSAVAVDTTTSGAKSILVSGTDIAGNLGSVNCAYTVGAPPTTTIDTPTTGATFTSTSPFLALTGTATGDSAITSVTWSNNRGGSGAATGTATWSAPVIPLQSGANVITVTSTDADGDIGTDTLTVNFNALTYYLAEGSTGFFDLDIALANPNPVEAHTTLTFLKSDGTTVVEPRTLPPTSRTTVRVDDIAGLSGDSVSTIVSSLDMLPLGVERTMSWDTNAYGGSGSEAVSQARTKWLFAEGSQGFFRTYLMVLNPGAAATTATVTFLPESGVPVVRTFPMAAASRLVIDASTVPELAFSSFGITVEATVPIVAERAMYWGNTPSRIFAGGHASVGAPDPSSTWFFAEGATGSFFDVYLLVGNPTATPANITLRYLLDNGLTVTRTKTVAPHARLTVDVEEEAPELKQAAFSTELTSDVPLVAERAMYWVGEPLPWMEGHDSLGIPAPGTKWILAEGRVGGPLGYQTYILLGNPSATDANVTITYLRADGTTATSTHTVAAGSRKNVFVNGAVSALHDESFAAKVDVTNNVGIVVERSMYWNAEGVVWAGGTNVTATRLP